VAPLTGRLRAGQLPRVIGIAFIVTTVLYLGLAVATISCLGHGADLNVPLADLLQLAIGPAGRAVAAAAALILTAGSVNAYLSGATEMLRELTAAPGPRQPDGSRQSTGSRQSDGSREPTGPRHRHQPSARLFLGLIGLTGLAVIALSALRLADTAALVGVPTAMFLCVYLSCTASAVRILAGPVRVAAAVALLAVLTILAFCGALALISAAVIAVLAIAASRPAAPAGRKLRRPSASAVPWAPAVTRLLPEPVGAASASGTARCTR
jgi:amino acid efflux transporter